ncbi:hypothetical protein CR205_10555 [Alteribacter lacisalsi]|uniref:Polymerase nucleotidyl transferase domain-containing protein n=1 Tax=Alteribacter lacisalsi TaxID=2045244 RepID=A0A2W0HQ48_9BACI|nr:nucleotidyltransferase domain-containing protein [Alteribacter lacisalsi]PYZ98979.1 hypothetical protein CR205_10555 [Alteribacter lacisalsi]
MKNLQAGDGLDRNGFIKSDVSIDKVNSIYMSCIRKAVEELKNLFPQQLHSIYLYGSAARGEASVPESDLDLLALFSGKLSSVESDALKKCAHELSRKYRSLVREVGIAAGYYDYVMDPVNYYEQAFLKEFCVCIHGEDLRRHFGPYKLSPEIAVSFNGDISKVFTRTMSRMEGAPNEDFNRITQGFARKLIRTYYSMVMVRSGIWSTRLHEQVEIVIRHFPDKEPAVHTLKKWIDDPPLDREAVKAFFIKEGKWATEHFFREVDRSV